RRRGARDRQDVQTCGDSQGTRNRTPSPYRHLLSSQVAGDLSSVSLGNCAESSRRRLEQGIFVAQASALVQPAQHKRGRLCYGSVRRGPPPLSPLPTVAGTVLPVGGRRGQAVR